MERLTLLPVMLNSCMAENPVMSALQAHVPGVFLSTGSTALHQGDRDLLSTGGHWAANGSFLPNGTCQYPHSQWVGLLLQSVCVCVCTCVCACVRVCMHACVCVQVCMEGKITYLNPLPTNDAPMRHGLSISLWEFIWGI